jgi:hypothetical protein
VHWAHLHKATWRLDNNQVKSALMVLKCEEGLNIEIIPIPTKDGISLLAFSFKNILHDYGGDHQDSYGFNMCEFSQH